MNPFSIQLFFPKSSFPGNFYKIQMQWNIRNNNKTLQIMNLVFDGGLKDL